MVDASVNNPNYNNDVIVGTAVSSSDARYSKYQLKYNGRSGIFQVSKDMLHNPKIIATGEGITQNYICR